MEDASPNGARRSDMNIYVAASLFALLILVYWVISELFTIIFRFFGLPEEKARFQVTSLITGTGFTTRESEMILTTKQRRRLARMTMLFGYVFNISVVSAFINVVMSLKTAQVGSFFLGVAIPMTAVAIVIILLRIRPIKVKVDNVLQKMVGSIMKTNSVNTVLLIDHIGKGTIAQVTIRIMPEEFIDIPLRKTGLKENKNILVMLVEHKDSKVEAPNANTVFVAGDKLTVFGDYKTICRVFHAHESFA